MAPVVSGTSMHRDHRLAFGSSLSPSQEQASRCFLRMRTRSLPLSYTRRPTTSQGGCHGYGLSSLQAKKTIPLRRHFSEVEVSTNTTTNVTNLSYLTPSEEDFCHQFSQTFPKTPRRNAKSSVDYGSGIGWGARQDPSEDIIASDSTRVIKDSNDSINDELDVIINNELDVNFESSPHINTETVSSSASPSQFQKSEPTTQAESRPAYGEILTTYGIDAKNNSVPSRFDWRQVKPSKRQISNPIRKAVRSREPTPTGPKHRWHEPITKYTKKSVHHAHFGYKVK